MRNSFDVAVIGAGVIGVSIARELSRFKLDICVFEKREDVGAGTSKANSGIVHAGFGSEPGSLMARLNVRGCEMIPKLAKDLDIPFRRNGTLVLCFAENDRGRIYGLLEQGRKNGVSGLRILEKEELSMMDNGISDNAICALFAPTGGIICPFTLTIAQAENAFENGVDFHMNCAVEWVERVSEGFQLLTEHGVFHATVIVNAAGVFGDEIHNMISREKIKITPRKGEYCLFDKTIGDMVNHTVFQMPGPMGKGVLVSPTIHGNLMIGPTAMDIDDKEGINTTAEGLAEVIKKGRLSLKEEIPVKKIITSFAGLRAHIVRDEIDFFIQEAHEAPGFVDAIGIESPGLSAAPAIGEYVAGIITARLKPDRKTNFIENRKGISNVASLDFETRRALIKKNPAYGHIVCRCEEISEGEVLDAIHRPLGAKSVDAVKRRTRAGMGRCQSGFCTSGILEVLTREVYKDACETTKSGGKSFLLSGKIRNV